jgi:hypothetical protein
LRCGKIDNTQQTGRQIREQAYAANTNAVDESVQTHLSGGALQ